MKKDPYSVIKRPMISEKINMLMNLKDSDSNKSIRAFKKSKYVFEVDKKANKKQIKEAFEELFKEQKILVDSVNTVVIYSKPRMYKGIIGKTKKRKKAIITLKQGHSIDEKKR